MLEGDQAGSLVVEIQWLLMFFIVRCSYVSVQDPWTLGRGHGTSFAIKV